MEKKIGIASDHAGYEMKEFLVGYLAAKGWDVLDFGPESEESVDYPDFAHPLANAIESGELERGIGLCGSGEGMAITLNKHQGIRAGLVWDKQIAHLIRQHNNANVIGLPARFITNDQARRIPLPRFRRRPSPATHREDSRQGVQPSINRQQNGNVVFTRERQKA